MKYFINACNDPYRNMAFDEWCLENGPSEEPVFYLWRNRPSVIVGLNQNVYSEVDLDFLTAHGILLARRVTGGGAVYHDLQNLNYTFAGPVGTVGADLFASALSSLGLDVSLTGRNDIFLDGRKISGYARRVWKDREIIHGTLMYDVDIETLTSVLAGPGSKLSAKGIGSVHSRVANLKEYLPQYSDLDSLQAALQEKLAGMTEDPTACDGPLELTASQNAEIDRMAREKFASWDWIYGRSRETGFTHAAKLPCGTVEARITLDRGIISALSFSGDFLGALPCDQPASGLVGTRYDYQSVLQALLTFPKDKAGVAQYFDSTTPEQLAALIVGQKNTPCHGK